MTGPVPLLTAKLRVPPPPPYLVPRPRLRRHPRIGGAPVTVVAAGAGWGKTTLLAEWARGVGAPVAWVSLDRGDEDPVRFWSYVTTALSRVAPAATGRALAASGAPGLDPLQVVVPELLNGLAEETRPLVLVLDDVHELGPGTGAAQGLEFFLDHQPPALRVVLAGRGEPPVELSRARARGRLVEIGVEDLRFSDAEAGELVAAVLRPGREVDGASGALAAAEGWPAGLVLGALALRGGRPGAGPRGRDHAVEFLTAEVLRSLPAPRRELLLASAALDRCSGPLLDAVLRRRGSGAELARLERDGLFVTTADGEWYRTHPLLRTALLREAPDPAQPDGVRRRAATWFAAAGLPEDAVRALLATGDQAGAAAALLAGVPAFLESGQVGVLDQLGVRLDLDRAPVGLLVALAWAAGAGGRPDRVAALLARAEEGLRAGDDPGYPGFASAAGAAAAVRSVYGTPDAPPGAALAHALRAAELEDDPHLPGWVVARVAVAGAHLSAGEETAPLTVLREAWSAPAVARLPVFSRLEVAGLLAWCSVRAGDRDGAGRLLRRTAPEVLDVETALGDAAAPAVALLHAVAAELHRGEGDLRAARRRSARAAELAVIGAHPGVAVLVLTAAADTAVRCGEGRAALSLLDQAREASRELPPGSALAARVDGLAREARREAVGEVATVLAEPLTERELALLRALRGELSQRQVAAQLHLSLNTVKGYAKSLYRKLGVASRADAVAAGRRLGLC